MSKTTACKIPVKSLHVSVSQALIYHAPRVHKQNAFLARLQLLMWSNFCNFLTDRYIAFAVRTDMMLK